MKANQLVSLFLFLMLGVAATQQTNSLLGGINTSDAFAFFFQPLQFGSLPDVTNSLTIELEKLLELKVKAEKGDATAQFDLGAMYADGRGVTQNYTEAVKWYRKAAEQGYAGAQNNLGSYYLKGYGVAKDDIEAVKWYRKAAEQGNAVAQYNFASCFWNGDGIPVDFVEAYKWCNLASAQGYDRAKETLSTFGRFMSTEQVAEAQ